MCDKIHLVYSETTQHKAKNVNPSYSPCTLKYFSRILGQQLNSFGVISEYDKIILAPFLYMRNEIRIRRIKITLSSVPSDFKGTISHKKSNGRVYLGLGRKHYKFNFLPTFKTKSAYGKYVKLQKSTKTEAFSVNIGLGRNTF